MSDRKTMLRELDEIRSDEELARRNLQPWFARPAVWVSAITATGLLGALILIFLFASA